MHEDSGVSSDGHVSWASAHCHVVESVHSGGVVDGALVFASPVNQSSSGIVEETGLDTLNVSSLASHFSNERSLNFSGHLLHGSLSSLCVSHGSLDMVCSNTFVEVKGAVRVSGTSTLGENNLWWLRGEGSVFSSEAGSKLVRIALGIWLNPSNEFTDSLGAVSNNSGLVLGNIIDH